MGWEVGDSSRVRACTEEAGWVWVMAELVAFRADCALSPEAVKKLRAWSFSTAILSCHFSFKDDTDNLGEGRYPGGTRGGRQPRVLSV